MEMTEIIELIKISILSSIGFVGVLLIFGFTLGAIEKRTTNNLVKRFGIKSVIITGIVGTTIHELSHYVVAKLFFHKVVGIKLFSLKIKSEQLGYVNHSYNRRNLYQRIGNFFIGIAPIVVGTGVIMVLFRYLIPDTWNSLFNQFGFNQYMNLSDNFKVIPFLSLLLRDAWLVISSIFSVNNILSISFWVFLFLAISISTHMELSSADFKGSFDGVLFIFIFSIIACAILDLFGVKVSEILHWILIYNVLVIVFLLFALIFSILGYVISLILSVNITA